MFRFWRKKKPKQRVPAGPSLSPEERDRLVAENLLPGKAVNLVISREAGGMATDSRASRVEEVDYSGMLALSQTDPPLSALNIGKSLTVTFLVKSGGNSHGRWQRVGYESKLVEVVRSPEALSDHRGGLLVVEPPNNLSISNLRFSPRRGALDSELELTRGGDGAELVILDLSEGGARFALPAGECHRDIGSLVDLNLNRGEISLQLKQAQVIRCEQGEAAVSFPELDSLTKHKLGKLLQALPPEDKQSA